MEQLPDSLDLPPPVEGSPDLLVIAGEHSGDEHAARMVADLRKRNPGLKVACLGGSELQAAGAQRLYDLTEVSIVGFVEVVRHYNFFKALFERTLKWIDQHRPSHICLVDYPGFNLRLAEQLKVRGISRKGGGGISISYYIGPQIWAWKATRRFKMAACLDRVGVIFPFEIDCYNDTDLPVEFVGHPFVRADYTLPVCREAGAPVLLLPGSRRAAVGRIFPLLLDGFRLARTRQPELRAEVIYPSPHIREVLEAVLNEAGDLAGSVQLVPNQKEPRGAAAVLMSSGTMSLACALAGLPGAIIYRLNPLSYWLGRLLISVPYIGIANLLLKRPLHPEFIQRAAQPKALAGQIQRALEDPGAIEDAAAGAIELRQLLASESEASAAQWLERGL